MLTHDELIQKVLQNPAVRAEAARLEHALVAGKPSPSLATLTRYAHALGKQLEVRFV